MRCKCCGEKAEFTVIPEDENENENPWEELVDFGRKFTTIRYKCSNCKKYFRADKVWVKNTKIVIDHGVIAD